ncbi:MAG: methyl-accepting chemotaxis protein [Candidatus Marinimicrobia bacterium]|nr:methyl-accepting chemotaxis protein [Candidatus Neomarinimicrobiota bacterium]
MIKKLLRNTTVRIKILVVFSTIFVVGFVLNFYVSSKQMKKDAIENAASNGRSMTTALVQVRENSAKLFEEDFYNWDDLFSDPEKLLQAVPVVRAFAVGNGLVEGTELKFRVPAFDARNPKNDPTAFEAEMLRKIESENLEEYWEINEATNELHFMSSVIIDDACLMCHGTIEQSVTGTTTDPVGFQMEGWKVGDRHGAFEFIMPLSGVDKAVASAALTSGSIIFGIIVVGIATLIFLLNVVFTKPINSMIEGMERLADNDFSTDVNLDTKDEFGIMAAAFNKATNSIRELLFQVRANVGQVASAATEIASAAEQSSAGAGEQEAQAGEVSASMEEMAATIVESSQNAASATESARKAAEVAGEGGKIVQETIEGMQRIAETVKASAATIGELGKRSDEIGEIIGVIDDIADQTNLLALNAAIEAARAGEQGRGFAVVADEVRKLAERTTKATAEIAAMIKGIQEDTSGAVTSMEEGTAQVETGTELAIKAGDSLSSIVSVVNEVQNMIEQIATASDEQSATAEQISGNVGNIVSVTKQSAQGAEQMATTAEELNRNTDVLSELVSKFKLEATTESHTGGSHKE